MGERHKHYWDKGIEVRVYNRYIFSLTLLFTLTAVVLAFYGQSRLDVCFSVYLIECLVLTSAFAYLNPKARKGLNLIWYALFGGFIFIVGIKLAEIILGGRLLR